MRAGRLWLLPLLAGLPLNFGLGAPSNAIEFNRDIRPILSENCFACHGHDKNRRKAKLRLDVREVAVERGAIVPGKPEESKLVEHIFAENPDDRMPPPDSRKVLTPAQKLLLKAWIAAGAVYEPHWAYIPPKRPEVPKTKDTAWCRNPIDAFILQGLEAKAVQPSPEADKRTLLRRLSLDLIGLPPTPEEVRAYLSDTSPLAYARQVDRLLDSPHYGERMAVPWLDLVRFADTVGYHGDQNQNDFPYRDYVIAAFNDNKPFDQFTIEQLAGDLLPSPSIEAQVGHQLQPFEHDDPRRWCSGQGIPGQVRRRSGAHGLDDLAGFHHGLRGVPRPQVRSIHLEGFLPDGGLLRRPEAMGHLCGLRLLALPGIGGVWQRSSLRARDSGG